jgi:hypothetical protein
MQIIARPPIFSSSHSQKAITSSYKTTTTDDDFIWSASPSDDDVTTTPIFPDILQERLDVLEKELAEDLGKLKQRAIMQ